MSKLAIQKPASAAERTEYRANVVPFPSAAQRRAKLELVPSVSGGRSQKQAIAPLSPSANRDKTASKLRGAISDFAIADGDGYAAALRQSLTNEDEIHLTPTDFVVATFLFLSALSGPALVWLFLQTTF
jgi:hypothetical protein